MNYLADYLESEYGLWRDPSDLIESKHLEILEILLRADSALVEELFSYVDSKLSLRSNLHTILKQRYEEAVNDFAIE